MMSSSAKRRASRILHLGRKTLPQILLHGCYHRRGHCLRSCPLRWNLGLVVNVSLSYTPEILSHTSGTSGKGGLELYELAVHSQSAN